MEQNLDLAIALYESEKLALEAKIRDCLEDFEAPDYRSANSHQQALYLVESTLRTLKKYKDPLLPEKEWIISRIKMLQKQIEKHDPFAPLDYLKRSIAEANEQLEKLNSIPLKNQPQLSETILDKAVSDLVANKIKKFRLVFNKGTKMRLDFARGKSSIKITFPNISQHLKSGVFYEFQLERLKRYSFSSINRNRLEATINIQDHQATYQYIRYLLVKVIVEMLTYADNRDDSYIEF